jgi:hypothetical protein
MAKFATFFAHLGIFFLSSIALIIFDFAGGNSSKDKDKPFQINWAHWPIIIWSGIVWCHGVLLLLSITNRNKNQED